MHITSGFLFPDVPLWEKGEGHHHHKRTCLLLALVGRRRRGPLVGARVRVLVVGAACKLSARRRRRNERSE
jgi:hypothetical protein